ncbi:MAG: hypothetical protein Q8L81_02660 [Bacteroidota bacterium]|nr:hypothetical protein [Bacteroidota bacterium]
MKTAIFVEGQTELIFVREFLKIKYDYDVDIICNTLCANQLIYAEYNYPCPNAENHFWIINVANDEAVLSQILLREEKLYEANYDQIIGLRDMYSTRYKKYSNAIDSKLIAEFIKGSSDSLIKAKQPQKIKFFYSIMEIESWLLAFDLLFTRIHPNLTNDTIKNMVSIDLSLDPELTHFHPASVVNEILSIIGVGYDKSKHEIESIVSKIAKEDYDSLYKKSCCQSYNGFYECFM